MANSRSRYYCFTLNNYTEASLARVRSLVDNNDGVVYCAFQPERGLAGDTPHLQGVLAFQHPRMLGGVLRCFAPDHPHVEVMRGTFDQAVDYCSKADTRDAEAGFGFEERGERPRDGAGRGQGFRSDFAEILRAVEGGADLLTVARMDPSAAIRYGGGIGRIIGLAMQPRNFKTVVRWYYGPTGSGKSRAAYEESGASVYTKMGDNKWWDGYKGEETTIIDDYRPWNRDFGFSYMLRLCDRYPMLVECKGGPVQFRSRRIFITCPRRPEGLWPATSGDDVQQLIRRINDDGGCCERFPREEAGEGPLPPVRPGEIGAGDGIELPVVAPIVVPGALAEGFVL